VSRTPTISFANFICRFGDQLVLLDLASEGVLPAFGDKLLRRKYGNTAYFLFGTKIREFPAVQADTNIPLIGIYGRFIKDTVLTKTQIFLPDAGLVADEGSMASAPSAFFVLIFNNHKSVYLPTMQDFLRGKHREFFNGVYDVLKRSGDPTTKKKFFEDNPPPDVAVVSLASKARIEQFVHTFEKLMQLELRILDTNQELQMEETYRRLREMKHNIGASKTQLIHNNPEGLDKAQAMEQIHASAAALGAQGLQ
jgi:hypothetical protein